MVYKRLPEVFPQNSSHCNPPVQYATVRWLQCFTSDLQFHASCKILKNSFGEPRMVTYLFYPAICFLFPSPLFWYCFSIKGFKNISFWKLSLQFFRLEFANFLSGMMIGCFQCTHRCAENLAHFFIFKKIACWIPFVVFQAGRGWLCSCNWVSSPLK